jgi:integrase
VVLPDNGLREPPQAGELPDVRWGVDASAEPFRSCFALIFGTGCEVTVAVGLRKRDVMPEIRARGTKTHNRDRIVRVAEWAWPHVNGLLAGKLPEAELLSDNGHQGPSKDVQGPGSVPAGGDASRREAPLGRPGHQGRDTC